MTGFVELISAREAGRTGSDHRDLFTGPLFWRVGHDPSLGESPFNDGKLDVFDGDCWLNDAEDAGTLAGSRADAPGELGKIVGLVQAIQSLPPQTPVDQVVELRDEIVDRTTAGCTVENHPTLAKGRAAVHTARPLFLECFYLGMFVKLVPVAGSLKR